MLSVQLTEWQNATPDTVGELRGSTLALSARDRELLDHLSRQKMLVARELREGLEVTTTSFVGSVNLGSLTLRIRPKIQGRPFSILLGYGLGLGDLEILPEHQLNLANPAFQDLLIVRLASEATRLLGRGIYRNYRPIAANLQNPRGTIDFRHLSTKPLISATLPCRYFERTSNVLPNRVLLSGLRLAGRLAIDRDVRGLILRRAAALEAQVEPVRLNNATFRALDRESSRLTSTYDSAFAIIRLLIAGKGIGPHADSDETQLPGFLFNMNQLFQEVVGRFLREWLFDFEVSEQHSLMDVFRYQALFNPKRKRMPAPRPDYVILKGRRVVAIADAKYRDLWEHELPADMLYQLSVYALSQQECSVATILYATASTNSQEARISINDPFRGHRRAEVRLRPVVLSEFADIVAASRSGKNDRRRREYAAHLAFGNQ